MNDGTRLALGLLLSGAIGWLAFRRESLSGSGVVGAVITGTLIFGLGGWSWGLLLIAFFISSSALSHYKASRKEAVAAEKFAKGGRRDLAQVLANGGLGALLATGAALLPEYRPLFFAAFAGAMATVTADTWATELGVLATATPRLITTGRPVSPGTSGGITMQGTLAADGGAALIGVLAIVLRLAETELGLAASSPLLPILPAAFFGGMAGALFDSLLGATVQAMFRCQVCSKETEKTEHHGQATVHLRGLRWMDNDVVNFLSSLAGSLVAVLFYQVLG